MSTSLKLHELNEYPEFKNVRQWKQVQQFLKSIQDHKQNPNVEIRLPRPLNDNDAKDFVDRFAHNFEYDHGRIMYRPRDEDGDYRINLQVIYPTKTVINDAIKGIFDDDKLGLGRGLQGFYEAVCSRFIGITKAMTDKFLRKQSEWQLTRPYFHKTNHPFTSGDGPNQRWYIDCVFLHPYGFDPKDITKFSVMSHNNEYEHRRFPQNTAGLISFRYLLTCVDGFSKKLWAEPLHEHTSGEVLQAFQKIMADSNTKPRCVVHDNGSEFQSVFKQFLKDQNIRNVETQSYSPMGNLAERYNRILREKIRAGIVRHNNLEWVKHLQDYVYNINETRHDGSKFCPNDIWSPGYRRLGNNLMQNINENDIEEMYPITDKSDWHDIRMQHRWNSIVRANKILNRTEPPSSANVFKPGDHVRIAGEVAYSQTRARNKDGKMKKYNAVIWSPEIFRVSSVVNKGHYAHNTEDLQNLGLQSYDLRRPRYNLQRMNGTMLSRQFYGSELQRVPKNSTETHITPHRSAQLNRLIEYDEF